LTSASANELAVKGINDFQIKSDSNATLIYSNGVVRADLFFKLLSFIFEAVSL